MRDEDGKKERREEEKKEKKEEEKEEEKEEKQIYLGIDLGTSNCCVGAYDPSSDKVSIVDISDDNTKLLPSWVHIQKDLTPKHIICGKNAKVIQSLHPETTYCNIKRIIGRQPFGVSKQIYRKISEIGFI